MAHRTDRLGLPHLRMPRRRMTNRDAESQTVDVIGSHRFAVRGRTELTPTGVTVTLAMLLAARKGPVTRNLPAEVPLINSTRSAPHATLWRQWKSLPRTPMTTQRLSRTSLTLLRR